MIIHKETYEKHMLSVPKGKLVFTENDPATEMFIIIEGEVEISKRTSLETSKTLIVLHGGDIFGEMAIIEKKPRSATAIALKDTKLLCLDESLFFSMIEKNPDFAVKIVKILSERVRRSNLLIQSLSGSSRESLVMNGLYEYAEREGIGSVKGTRISRDKFIAWGTHHLGLQAIEIVQLLRTLVTKKKVLLSTTPGELILTPRQKEISNPNA
jgi:CRP-like cAMP-binding protein